MLPIEVVLKYTESPVLNTQLLSKHWFKSYIVAIGRTQTF